MRIRTALGRFLTRIGKFIQSLAVVIMRPDDLAEFSRLAYSSPTDIKTWTRKGHMESGLAPLEKASLEKIPVKTGRLLLLGVGGGREAIPLARMGYQVTGVDFVPYLVEQARKNALEHGVVIEGLVQDMSRLAVEPDSYDLACLFTAMYSCVPTRARRVAMLRRILGALKEGGYFLCQFQYHSPLPGTPKGIFLRKVFAYFTLGNIHYEKGDMIWRESEFVHTFWSRDLLISEFEEGGFEVIDLDTPEASLWGSAILRKPARTERES